MKLEGSIVAVITPMHEDGSIDIESLKKLLKFHLEEGTDGVLICGTTGELATLDEDEYKKIIEVALSEVNKKIPLIAGIGGNDTKKVLKNLRYAERAGVDAVLAVTPYYNKPTQEGLYAHYKCLSEHTTLAIILYNVPSRTAVSISEETVCRLSELKNIVGIKEASGDLKSQARLHQLCGEKFLLISGDDFTVLPTLSIGGRGVISVVANIVPALNHRMIKSFLDGDYESAKTIFYNILPLIFLMFIETNPAPCKEALYIMGKIKYPGIRLPLVRVTLANREKIQKTLREANLI